MMIATGVTGTRMTKSTGSGPGALPGASALDLIGKMASAGGADGNKKKSGKPQFHDQSLNEHIESFIEHKKRAETAEALRDAAKEQIIVFARQARLEHCSNAGAVVASIGINNRVTFTQQKRYSKVPEDRLPALQEAFGDVAGRYFKPTLKISLSEASANNERVLNELVEKLGPEFFAAHFEVKRDLDVTESFHNDYSTSRAVQALAQPFIDDETIRAYSPSLKVS